ncbi:hypothetical protein [Tengunoibacter tsumagoiensis]|uniref:Uncharacterized protein n=1 Tax=Tengunoibacter tsumagoiensis TaxID=2014871 RepID=A0A402A7N1_9CHLR|nr:hypothetical protein [Tengunoibacter tsumagoiensis]GCE15069.1 hypothetical protein KTT_49280 [Tengunoibacter tsumagoiensis]
MSHIEEGKTNLLFQEFPALLRQGNQQALAQHPCMKLLHQAALLVARQYDGELLPYYYTYFGQERLANTGLAVHIPVRAGKPEGEALPRGIGLIVDEQTGELKFLGDPWGVDEHFYQKVQHAIVQNYTVLAHMAVLQHMQYQVSTQQIDEHIAITGGSYAVA